jgi:hypothetical protein
MRVGLRSGELRIRGVEVDNELVVGTLRKG